MVSNPGKGHSTMERPYQVGLDSTSLDEGEELEYDRPETCSAAADRFSWDGSTYPEPGTVGETNPYAQHDSYAELDRHLCSKEHSQYTDLSSFSAQTDTLEHHNFNTGSSENADVIPSPTFHPPLYTPEWKIQDQNDDPQYPAETQPLSDDALGLVSNRTFASRNPPYTESGLCIRPSNHEDRSQQHRLGREGDRLNDMVSRSLRSTEGTVSLYQGSPGQEWQSSEFSRDYIRPADTNTYAAVDSLRHIAPPSHDRPYIGHTARSSTDVSLEETHSGLCGHPFADDPQGSVPSYLSTDLTAEPHDMLPEEQEHDENQNPVLKCPICGTSFSGRYGDGNWQRHMRTQHPEEELRLHCPVLGCHRSYKRSDALLKHKRAKHPGLVPAAIPRPRSRSRPHSEYGHTEHEQVTTGGNDSASGGWDPERGPMMGNSGED